MSDFVLTASALNAAQDKIFSTLIHAGVRTAMLIDCSGNILVYCGQSTQNMDTISLAALAAANFGATTQIAQLIGEDDFSLLFHKGKKENIHICRVGEELILVTIFGQKVSLGMVRRRVAELSESIKNIFDR